VKTWFQIFAFKFNVVCRYSELHSELAGRDVAFTGSSKVAALPAWLNVQMVRFFWKQDIQAKAGGLYSR
jgi:hypothetical protein